MPLLLLPLLLLPLLLLPLLLPPVFPPVFPPPPLFPSLLELSPGRTVAARSPAPAERASTSETNPPDSIQVPRRRNWVLASESSNVVVMERVVSRLVPLVAVELEVELDSRLSSLVPVVLDELLVSKLSVAEVVVSSASPVLGTSPPPPGLVFSPSPDSLLPSVVTSKEEFLSVVVSVELPEPDVEPEVRSVEFSVPELLVMFWVVESP